MSPSGIIMTNGFFTAAKKPADLKYLADTIADRDKYVTDGVSYEGMLVYVRADKKTYQFVNDVWKEFGFNSENFVQNVYDDIDSDSSSLALSARQGKVLNTKIANHTNNTAVHVTAAEKTAWNAKASTNIATTTSNGLMSYQDKVKLDSVESGANNYVHPNDANTRHVSEDQIARWNNKADNFLATISANGLMPKEDKTKLDGIEEYANNYVHPQTHNPTIIVQDASHRFITDSERTLWNEKASNAVATQSSNGLMSAIDKTKLDSVQSGANNYTHPTEHPATMITQDDSHRFVTKAQIDFWDSKSTNIPDASPDIDGLLSAEDKRKLDSIEFGSNNYTHPVTHEATIIEQDDTHRFVSDAQIIAWTDKADKTIATQTTNGLMSSIDKKNLDDLLTRMTQMETNQAAMLAKLKTAVFYVE